MPRVKKNPADTLVELINAMEVEQLEQLKELIDKLIEEKSSDDEEALLLAQLEILRNKKKVASTTKKATVKKKSAKKTPKIRRIEKSQDDAIIEEGDDDFDNPPPVRRGARRPPKMGKGEVLTRAEPLSTGPRPNLFDKFVPNAKEANELAKAKKFDKLNKNNQPTPRRESSSLVEIDCDKCGKAIVISEKLYFPGMNNYCDRCIPKG